MLFSLTPDLTKALRAPATRAEITAVFHRAWTMATRKLDPGSVRSLVYTRSFVTLTVIGLGLAGSLHRSHVGVGQRVYEGWEYADQFRQDQVSRVVVSNNYFQSSPFPRVRLGTWELVSTCNDNLCLVCSFMIQLLVSLSGHAPRTNDGTFNLQISSSRSSIYARLYLYSTVTDFAKFRGSRR